MINESEAEGDEARKFLEDVRVMFPQVCRVIGLLCFHGSSWTKFDF